MTWRFGESERLAAVVPDGIRCGLAQFERPPGQRWQCTRAYQVGPDRAVDLVAGWMQYQELGYLVVPRPRIFKHINEGTYGNIEVAKVYGAIVYVHRLNQIASASNQMHPISGKRYQAVAFGDNRPGAEVPVKHLLAGASIRSVAVSTDAGELAKLAELHGWAWLFTFQEQECVGGDIAPNARHVV